MKPKLGVFSLRGWLYWQLRVLPGIKDVFKSILSFLDEMITDTESSIGISFLLFGIYFPVVYLVILIISEIFSIPINDYMLLIISVLPFLGVSFTHYLLYVYKAELKEKNDETQSR